MYVYVCALLVRCDWELFEFLFLICFLLLNRFSTSYTLHTYIQYINKYIHTYTINMYVNIRMSGWKNIFNRNLYQFYGYSLYRCLCADLAAFELLMSQDRIHTYIHTYIHVFVKKKEVYTYILEGHVCSFQVVVGHLQGGDFFPQCIVLTLLVNSVFIKWSSNQLRSYLWSRAVIW